MCFCIESSIGARGGVGWLSGCFKPPGGLNIWPVTKNVLFSLLMYIIITIYGRVKKSVMPLFIF